MTPPRVKAALVTLRNAAHQYAAAACADFGHGHMRTRCALAVLHRVIDACAEAAREDTTDASVRDLREQLARVDAQRDASDRRAEAARAEADALRRRVAALEGACATLEGCWDEARGRATEFETALQRARAEALTHIGTGEGGK